MLPRPFSALDSTTRTRTDRVTSSAARADTWGDRKQRRMTPRGLGVLLSTQLNSLFYYPLQLDHACTCNKESSHILGGDCQVV